MNETPPGSSYKSSRILPGSGSAVIIPPGGLSGGPETVINPEGRPVSSEGSGIEPGSVSELATVLFPAAPSGSGSHFPGPQGILLGHFRIESCIRNGGMGAVFKAVDIRLNRVVALKVLPPGHSRDASIVQRFRHEAQAAARLDHENIAQVHYIGEDQGLHFIAFEFVSGKNLRDLIQERGTIPPEEAVNFTLQVAHALVHTSLHGVVHRDIKPSNLIITPEGKAKLVDLGLARLEDREPAEQLTVAGTTLGTFDYISPEQAKDPRLVDVRSDIYSLGCTLYHMLTGEPPYAEGTMLQKLLDHQAKDVPDPRAKNRFLSSDLSAIVQKMMAPDPLGRYQSPEHLIRDLLYVADSMGLEKIPGEGRIWMSGQDIRQSFLQKHGGWLISAVVLMAFVSYLKYSDDRTGRYQLPTVPRTSNPDDTTAKPAGSDLPAPGNQGAIVSPNETRNSEPLNPESASSTTGATVSTDRKTDPVATSPSGQSPLGGGEAGTEKKPADEIAPLTAPDKVFTETANPPKFFENLPPLGAGDPENPQNPGTGEAVAADPKTGGGSKVRMEPPLTTSETGMPFLLLGSAGTSDRRFPTLEAACAEAVDGSVIELRFDGIQKQRPIRVSKKITIRAGRGHTPQLEMQTQPGDDGRLITLNGGSLLLFDVNLIVRSGERSMSETWSLFSVQRGEQLRLENSAVTLIGESGKAPSLFEFRASAMDSSMGMDPVGPSGSRSPFRVELQNSMIRGDGDVFVVRHAQGLRLSVKNCIIAVTGTLLRSEGNDGTVRASSPIEMQLEQNTVVVNGGLLSFEAGELPRTLSRVDVQATNNIITAAKVPDVPLKPLVSMTGNIPQDDFMQLLGWSGLKNFYYPFETFWMAQSTDVTGKSVSLKFPDWTRRWGTDHEVDAHDGLIIWLQSWSAKPFSELIPGDFKLDPSAAQINPAISGANDGGDAGVDLEEFPELRVDPVLESVP